MLAVLCVLLLVACQGLGGEPRIIATIPPPTATAEVTESIPATATPAAIAMGNVEAAQAGQESGGRVVGQVINQSADAELPIGLEVVLVIVTTTQERLVRETTTDDTGRFEFIDVPFVGGYLYFTVVEYDDVPYISETASAAPSMSQLDLSLLIFETTDDRNAAVITSILSQVDAVGDFLEFADTISIVNPTDRTLLTDLRGGTQNRRSSLAFDLPPGALFIGVPGDSAAFFDSAASRVYLTNPLYAGQNTQLTIQYVVPYRNAAIIEFPVAYALNGAMGLLVQNPALTITAEWIITDEPREVGGQTLRLLGGPLTLSAGELVRYDVNGASVAIGTSGQGDIITADTLLPLVLIFAVILISVVAGVAASVRRGAASATDNKDVLINNLLRQIQHLDSQHDSGELNHDVYQRRKADLMARLAELRDPAE